MRSLPIFYIIKLLVVSLIISVLVSWSLAVAGLPQLALGDGADYLYVNIEDREFIGISLREGFGSEYIAYNTGLRNLDVFASSHGEKDIAMNLIPSWAPQSLEPEAVIIHVATGWPLKSLYYSSTSYSRYAYVRTEGGITIRQSRYSFYTRAADYVLPLKPIVLGLLVNTATCSIAIALLHWICWWTRGMWRRHRGRCIQCGYVLAGLNAPGCPECGWNRAEDGHGG